MKKPYPHQITVRASGKYVLDRISPKLKVLLEGSHLPTAQDLSQILERALREVFLISDFANVVVKFNQAKIDDSISGPIGKLSYAHSRKIQNYARRRPQNPPKTTPARLAQQNYMRQAISAWKSSNNSIKTAWNDVSASQPYSGTHLFQGVYMALLIENLPIPSPFLPDPTLLKWYFTRKTSK